MDNAIKSGRADKGACEIFPTAVRDITQEAVFQTLAINSEARIKRSLLCQTTPKVDGYIFPYRLPRIIQRHDTKCIMTTNVEEIDMAKNK